MPTAVRSHAKINLGLGIGAGRTDGFHALVTVYQTLEVHDRVIVTAKRADSTAIRLTSNDRRVPTDHRNTAWKMVEFAVEALRTHAEVHVHIEKRLPVQGGLGAGSANAVAALVGLEAELGIGPENHPGWAAQRLHLCERVGSDVPLFLIGGAVLGMDRGQSVFPLPDFAPIWTVIATPSVGVSTPQAFRHWDELCAREGLTESASADKLSELSRAYAACFAGVEALNETGLEAKSGSSGVLAVGEDLAGPQVSALVRTGIANDFERVVFPQHPLLSEIKRTLAASGTPEAALYASLSGSGSALFGLYRGERDAEAARQRLREQRVESLLTRTLPRASYWRNMILRQD
jgi:4-diphosphocytidyl-2-C-methyl-D-erythritol kinase